MKENKVMKIFEIKNLSLTDGEKEILNNVSLEIEEGSHLTITGPSGGGKSTLLKAIASLVDYSSGELLYKGKSLKEIDPILYRREVSYCFQQPVLFGETVKDCLTFPFEIRKLSFDENKVISLLSGVNLSSEFLSQEIAKLSGGEKQRVALVRNMIFAPKVILLDEVTAGLDSENKEIVRQFVKKQMATVIEVTHDNEELEEAQKLVRIEDGGLISNNE